MAVPIRSQNYHDPVAAKRRHRVWFVRTFGAIFVLGAIGTGIWGVGRMHLNIPWPQDDQKPTISSVPEAIGTWCVKSTCQFFDRNGAQWGTALESSGPILLLVDDQRSSASAHVRLTPGIISAVDTLPSLGLTARRVTLSDAQPGATIITNKSYVLYIDPLGNVTEQMSTLAIFLSDRAKDPAFAPAYIDLRTMGRIYYK